MRIKLDFKSRILMGGSAKFPFPTLRSCVSCPSINIVASARYNGMQFLPTTLTGVVVIEPTVFEDDRGFFMESYHRPKFAAAGIGVEFVRTIILARAGACCADCTISWRIRRGS